MQTAIRLTEGSNLTTGKIYDIIEIAFENKFIMIKDDLGEPHWYNHNKFELNRQ